MIRPDVIVVNPSSVDYPLWRATMEKVRGLLGTITIVHSIDNKGKDLSGFIKGACPWATHIQCSLGPGDWRNIAVTAGIVKATSDWILFMEQDFVPLIPLRFFQEVCFEPVLDHQVDGIGFVDGDRLQIGTRLHPAFLAVRRSLVMQTSLDFAAHTERGLDHFGVFSDDLINLGAKIVTLQNLNLWPDMAWTHWAGVTHNFHLVMQGQKPCYKPDEFKRYVEMGMNADVVQDPDFLELCKKCLKS